jgi:hypothetical protein
MYVYHYSFSPSSIYTFALPVDIQKTNQPPTTSSPPAFIITSTHAACIIIIVTPIPSYTSTFTATASTAYAIHGMTLIVNTTIIIIIIRLLPNNKEWCFRGRILSSFGLHVAAAVIPRNIVIPSKLIM